MFGLFFSNPKAFLGKHGAAMMIQMHYGTFMLSNEPPDEPLERLLTEADRRGLADRILVAHPGEGVEF